MAADSPHCPILETIVIAPPLGIHLHLDAVALLLVALFSFAGAIVAAFIWLDNSAAHLRERPAFILILLLIAGSNGMVLTGDIFNLYVFIEIVGVSAYALAAIRRDKTALEAGLKYDCGSVAAIFILFAIVLLYLQTGSTKYRCLAQAFGNMPAQMQLLIGLLMLIGLGIKAELFPFNFWVPRYLSRQRS
ncbi:proton-conducting transporter membrane subunit [Chromatium okenii]|uniref:proton-conducting transporter transmembrane domain-containing protein n=1 Tax=Chromatium okenii TaxID=61644 RepID=UPI001F5B8688|nr:proton-conducting transporter membrane subunit [Chromatium okenii]